MALDEERCREIARLRAIEAQSITDWKELRRRHDLLKSALEAIRALGPTELVGTGPTPWDIASAALRHA
jgi:hypothetical protein